MKLLSNDFNKPHLVRFYNLIGPNQEPSYEKRCPNDGKEKVNTVGNTLPTTLAWDSQQSEEAKLTRCALRILEFLVTSSFGKQVIAIAAVKVKGWSDNHDPELFIAGNLEEPMIPKDNAAVTDGILHILDYEGVKYSKVVVLLPEEQTANKHDEKGHSLKHAEMQIMRYVMTHNENEKKNRQKKKTISSFHIRNFVKTKLLLFLLFSSKTLTSTFK